MGNYPEATLGDTTEFNAESVTSWLEKDFMM